MRHLAKPGQARHGLVRSPRTSTSSPTGYASRVAAASLTGWPPFPTWPPKATRFPSRGHVALLIPSYCSLPDPFNAVQAHPASRPDAWTMITQPQFPDHRVPGSSPSELKNQVRFTSLAASRHRLWSRRGGSTRAGGRAVACRLASRGGICARVELSDGPASSRLRGPYPHHAFAALTIIAGEAER